MTNNAIGMTSMAACPQLPYELVNEPERAASRINSHRV